MRENDHLQRSISANVIQSEAGQIELIPQNRDAASSEDPDAEVNIDYPDGGLKAYTVLFGSFLGLTSIYGTLNSVGAIQTYLSAHQLSKVSSAAISWIFSIYLALAFTLTVVVGPYFDSHGSLRPMLLGGGLSFIGMMATANCTQVWHFILAFSLCNGIGNALCISPLVGVISHWFFNKIGLAIGLASVGGSVGGVVIPLMLRSLYPKVGFAWTTRILALFCLILNIIATFLIEVRFKTVNPQDSLQKIDHSKREKFLNASKDILNFTAVKDPKFLFLVLGVSCGELALLSTSTYYGTYAVAQGMSESNSYILLTIFNGVGILGRTFPSYLSDKLGYFNVMIVMILGSAVSILAMWLPFGSNRIILYVFILIFGFTSSLILSLTPACLRQITPVREFGSRYGLMYFFVSIGNLIGIPIASAIIGDLSKLHYDMFALFCGLITILSSSFWIFSRYKAVGFRIIVKV